jgi:hypothetical protein
MIKFGGTKVLTIIGFALTLAGSLVSSVAGSKKTEETIARLVDKKLESN